MNTFKKCMIMMISTIMISFMSACVVVHDGHPHHHWHHGPVVHEDVIIR